MNTRQYHRNSGLAFPRTADYACAITRPRQGASDGAVWLALACGAIAAVIAMIWG